MKCNECRELLVAYLKGLLDDGRQMLVDTHLARCSKCLAELRTARQATDQLAREELSAYLDNLLDQATQSQGSHLAECSGCQAELRAVRQLTVRWVRDELSSRSASHETAITDRILNAHALQVKHLKTKHLQQLVWLSVMLAIAVGMLFASIVWRLRPSAAQRAAVILARAAEAVPNINTIHFVAKMRTIPNGTFSSIDAGLDFVPVEVWRQFGETPKWRVQKPGRMAVMDGDSTVMLSHPQVPHQSAAGEEAPPIFIKPETFEKISIATEAPFQTRWVMELTKLQETMTRELRTAQARGWILGLSQETTAAGEAQLLVSVEGKSGTPKDDELKDTFFDLSEMRHVYRFDAATLTLTGIDAYLHQRTGDVLVLSIEHIDYNKGIDSTVFKLNLPGNAQSFKEPELLPNNESLEKMTPKDTVRAFFEACAKEDWDEAQKYWSMPDGKGPPKDSSEAQKFWSMPDGQKHPKEYLRGLEIVKIGEPFQSSSGDWFVPSEIKLKDGTIKKQTVSVRKHPSAKRYIIDGGI